MKSYLSDIEEFKCLLNKKDFDNYLKNTKDENYEYIGEILLSKVADFSSCRIENTLIGLDDVKNFYINTNTKFRGYW